MKNGKILLVLLFLLNVLNINGQLRWENIQIDFGIGISGQIFKVADKNYTTGTFNPEKINYQDISFKVGVRFYDKIGVQYSRFTVSDDFDYHKKGDLIIAEYVTHNLDIGLKLDLTPKISVKPSIGASYRSGYIISLFSKTGFFDDHGETTTYNDW